MAAVLHRWSLWLVANLLGIALFLHFAIPTWIEPELANEPGAGGGAFMVWGISALPILVLFLAAHVPFGLIAYRERETTGSWRGQMLVGATLFCWLVTFLYDNAHHGT